MILTRRFARLNGILRLICPRVLTCKMKISVRNGSIIKNIGMYRVIIMFNNGNI